MSNNDKKPQGGEEPKPVPTMKADKDQSELEEQLDANVTKDERELLEKSENSLGTEDDIALEQAQLDDTDEEGTPLNEDTGLSGDDLDVPSGDEDETDPEDEENDSYSLNDDKEDNIDNRG